MRVKPGGMMYSPTPPHPGPSVTDKELQNSETMPNVQGSQDPLPRAMLADHLEGSRPSHFRADPRAWARAHHGYSPQPATGKGTSDSC